MGRIPGLIVFHPSSPDGRRAGSIFHTDESSKSLTPLGPVRERSTWWWVEGGARSRKGRESIRVRLFVCLFVCEKGPRVVARASCVSVRFLWGGSPIFLACEFDPV